MVDATLDVGLKSYLFGQGNPEPLFYLKNFKINKNNIRIIGKNYDTVKILGTGIDFIKFRCDEDFIKKIENCCNSNEDYIINLVGKANLNEWNGGVTPQIFIDDIEIIDLMEGF